MARRPVDPNQSFPQLEEQVLARWRERDVFAESLRRREGAEPLGLLGGAADRQRPARLAPRPGARVQGHLPALQDDARPLRGAQGRLGLPRPAGRDHRRAAARAPQQARHRGLRDRGVQREVPRVGLRVPRGLEPADRAHRLLGRPRHAYRTLDTDLHRVGLVGAAPDLRQGPALRGPQGGALLPALRHGAVSATSSRWATRTSSTRRSTCASRCRGRRPAAGRRRAAGVDDDAVDAGLQRGGRRRPRADLRARQDAARSRRRSCWPRRWSSGCSAPTPTSQILARFPGAALDGVALRAAVPLHQGRRSTASAGTPSCSATSSPPTTAPASCTPRSPSARTTSASARSTA